MTSMFQRCRKPCKMTGVVLETEEFLLSSRGDAEGSKGAADSGRRHDAKWGQIERTVQEVQETLSAGGHDQRYRSLRLIFLHTSQRPPSELSSAANDEDELESIFISAVKRPLGE